MPRKDTPACKFARKPCDLTPVPLQAAAASACRAGKALAPSDGPEWTGQLRGAAKVDEAGHEGNKWRRDKNQVPPQALRASRPAVELSRLLVAIA